MRTEAMAGLLRVLGHPSRLRILLALQERQRCVKVLMDALGIRQSNLSQHLRILRDAGVVGCQRRGVEVCYRIQDERALHIIHVTDELLNGRAS